MTAQDWVLLVVMMLLASLVAIAVGYALWRVTESKEKRFDTHQGYLEGHAAGRRDVEHLCCLHTGRCGNSPPAASSNECGRHCDC